MLLETMSEARQGFMLETDHMDDPARPGAVLGPKTVPKRTRQLSEAGVDDEVLYRLFELLCLGGPLAQPDLELDHYLKATKALYRDCVQVYKRSSDGATCLANEAYEVAGPLVFGNGDPRPLARCLIITEPKRAKALVVFSPARGCGNFRSIFFCVADSCILSY